GKGRGAVARARRAGGSRRALRTEALAERLGRGGANARAGATMRLEEVIRGIAITDRRGRFDVEVSGLASDSRKVKSGDLFVAIRGVSQAGHGFIDEALKKGAVAVLAETWPDRDDTTERVRPNVVLVPNARRALALSAANFYGQPSRKMVVAGVTGTNG